MAHHNI